jgi:uncharacterized damage-inducible protein DinB
MVIRGYMKNILMLYAKYNKDTNNQIIQLLSTLSDEELKRERKMYYKSISNLFNHLVIGEWYYLNAVLFISGGNYCADSEERSKTFQRIETSFTEAVTIMQGLNDRLIEFINKVTEDELKLQKKNMTIYNGRVVDISIWEYITQHITHQLHHKGQLSQVFDELEIEHEFGNIFPYVLDSIKEN